MTAVLYVLYVTYQTVSTRRGQTHLAHKSPLVQLVYMDVDVLLLLLSDVSVHKKTINKMVALLHASIFEVKKQTQCIFSTPFIRRLFSVLFSLKTQQELMMEMKEGWRQFSFSFIIN